MSVPSNISQWQPTLPVSQSIYEDTSDQQAPLGTRLVVGDRVFYYAVSSASQARGTVLCSTAPTASHNGALTTFAATSADAKIVTVTAGSAVATSEYNEGYVGISKGTMGGATYRVLLHGAISSGASGTIELYDRLYDDVAAADEAGLIHNIYRHVIVASSALAAVAACVPMVDVATDGYFWGQTYGPAAPLNQAATPAASVLVPGTTGGVLAAATDNLAGNPFIGQNYNLAGTAGEYTPCFLTIRH